MEENKKLKYGLISLGTTVGVGFASYLGYKLYRPYKNYRYEINANIKYLNFKKYEEDGDKEITINTEDRYIDPMTSYLYYFMNGKIYKIGADLSIYKNTYNNFIKRYSKFKITDDIVINIKTTGGSIYYATLICKIINNHQGKVTAKITEYASSAGTYIALCCDEILMNNTSALGMIDPQFNYDKKYYSAKEVVNAEPSPKETFEDKLLKEKAKNIIKTTTDNIQEFLPKNYDPNTITNILDVFYNSDNCHSKHIFYNDVKAVLGDKVKLVAKSD